MKQKLSKLILLTVVSFSIVVLYNSCKKLDIEREIMTKTLDATGVGISEATLRCEMIDLGEGNITEFGCCYSIYGNPTIIDNRAATPGNPEVGIYSLPISGLQPNTEYFFRAYAIQGSIGMVAYGAAVSFTTEDLSIETLDATDMTETSANLHGEIIDLGGVDVASYGFVYSTNYEPTVADSKLDLGDNPSTGIYTSALEGLNLNTTYYFRAYAEVSENGYVSYGSIKTFQTLDNPDLPSVTTDQVYDVNQVAATCTGNVSSEGSSTVTKKGFCISEEQNPTIDDLSSENGSGIGQFINEFTDLSANVTYYVRAYAQNSHGTAYGEQLSFYTSTGTWMHYDDGENFEAIGLNNGGDFDVAIRYEPNQLQNYDGWEITKFRFFPRTSFPTTYSIEIYTGADGTELEYIQDVATVEPNEWNEVILEIPHVIDASKPLYPGYLIQNQPIGEFPAGTDEGPAISESGDLISIDGVPSWVAMSIANPDFSYNWNLQIYVSNESGEEQLLSPTLTSDPHKKITGRSLGEVSSSNQSNR